MEGPTCKTEVRLQIKNAFLEIYKLMEKMTLKTCTLVCQKMINAEK